MLTEVGRENISRESLFYIISIHGDKFRIFPSFTRLIKISTLEAREQRASLLMFTVEKHNHNHLARTWAQAGGQGYAGGEGEVL